MTRRGTPAAGLLLTKGGIIMTLINDMANELKYEKNCLKAALEKNTGYDEYGLIYSSGKDGFSRFYKILKGSGSRTYIKRGNFHELRQIAFSRYNRHKIDILDANIHAIESFLKKYREYDHISLLSSLPNSYRKAIELVSLSPTAPELIQSENPKHREQLTVEVSNGLMVRSKSELGIAECLLYYGQRFQYEKAVVLSKVHVNPDGTAWVENVTVYPDFTIFLPDGSVIYWEHCGLFDREPYRTDNHKKFDLYYENNIYPPKNLIITMDGPGKPFSNIEIRRIIQGLIIPRC